MAQPSSTDSWGASSVGVDFTDTEYITLLGFYIVFLISLEKSGSPKIYVDSLMQTFSSFKKILPPLGKIHW